MILLDANVLIDAADPLTAEHAWARRVLRCELERGVNVVALVEAAVRCDLAVLLERLAIVGIQVLDVPAAAAGPCLRAWREYLPRRKQGPPPQVPLPDFFIGAHAEVLGANLASRDVGRYREYFPRVRLVTPDADMPSS